MEAVGSKTSSEMDTAGEGTDSLADILSSSPETSDSSLTSLTSDNLLQLTTEDEKPKPDTKAEKSGTDTTESNITSNISQIPDLNTQDWYLHPMFQRYWKHYSFAMAWCQSHHSVTQKLQQNGHVYSRHSQPYSKTLLSKQKKSPQNLKTSKRPTFKIPKTANHQSKKYANVSFSEESTTCDDSRVSDADSEVYEMEITEEMVDFFAQSEKHRKERDESKKEPGGKSQSLVDIGKANKKVPTSEAPKERPGLRRTTEMTQLYGKGAAMIHGMETALQMTYDRNVDIKQPPLWPNMPLKIVFS